MLLESKNGVERGRGRGGEKERATKNIIDETIEIKVLYSHFEIHSNC